MSEKQYPSDKQDKFMLRFPDGMRDRIREEAEANGRSMNAEIIHRLEQSFANRSIRTGTLLTAEEARQQAEETRVHLKAAFRDYLIEEVDEAISRGASELYVDLMDFFGTDDTNDDFSDPVSEQVINPVFEEFRQAGYKVLHNEGIGFWISF